MKSGNPLHDGVVTSGSSESYWIDSAPRIKGSKKLQQNINTDVVIVGGGLAGISIAYNLITFGRKVVVIEDGWVGSGETGRTTAQLVTALDERYSWLEKIFGKEDTRLIAKSHRAAIQHVEQIIKKENIDCQFVHVPGYLFRHPSDDVNALEEEHAAAINAGVEVRLLDKVPNMTNVEGPCLEFANQAQFHPLLYLQGLCRVIESKGGLIFTETHAAEISHEGIVTTEGFIVTANHVVVATNSPVNNLVAMHLKQSAYRTYVVGGLVKKDLIKPALWWDTGDHDLDADMAPYHYVRLQPYNDEFDLIMSGGEDHRTGDTGKDELQEEERFTQLTNWTTQHFPVEQILYKWSGQVMEPVDGIGFIGRNPLDKDNVYIVTGDSGTGMTHCSIAGILITDLIMDKKNPWEELYNPSRITAKTGNIFFKELLHGVMATLKGAPADDRVKELSNIKIGEGKITKVHGHKCAVYRDELGEFHIVSSRCTHLGARLTWNEAEKSWDCPWHGSRFTCDGQVINGPAINNLAVFEDAEKNSDQ